MTDDELLFVVARLERMTPAQVRSMFNRGYTYSMALAPGKTGWRDAFGDPPPPGAA